MFPSLPRLLLLLFLFTFYYVEEQLCQVRWFSCYPTLYIGEPKQLRDCFGTTLFLFVSFGVLRLFCTSLSTLLTSFFSYPLFFQVQMSLNSFFPPFQLVYVLWSWRCPRSLHFPHLSSGETVAVCCCSLSQTQNNTRLFFFSFSSFFVEGFLSKCRLIFASTKLRPCECFHCFCFALQREILFAEEILYPMLAFFSLPLPFK